VRFHVCFAKTSGSPAPKSVTVRGKGAAKARAARPTARPPAGVQRHAVLLAREQGGRVTIKKLFARFLPPRHTMPRHFEGHVIKKLFAGGSKSQRKAVILKTADDELVLRREGGNAFQDPVLDGLVGHRIRGTGEKTGYTLILRKWEVLGESEPV